MSSVAQRFRHPFPACDNQGVRGLRDAQQTSLMPFRHRLRSGHRSLPIAAVSLVSERGGSLSCTAQKRTVELWILSRQCRGCLSGTRRLKKHIDVLLTACKLQFTRTDNAAAIAFCIGFLESRTVTVSPVTLTVGASSEHNERTTIRKPSFAQSDLPYCRGQYLHGAACPRDDDG